MYTCTYMYMYLAIHYNFCPALCFVKLPGNVITEAVSVKKDHTPCPPYKLITAHLGGPPNSGHLAVMLTYYYAMYIT